MEDESGAAEISPTQEGISIPSCGGKSSAVHF